MSNLINSYRFGGSAFDFGNALTFPGVNDYVSLPSVFAYKDYVMSGWFKKSDTNNRMLYGSLAGISYVYNIFTNTKIRLSDSNAALKDYTITLTANTWKHLYIVGRSVSTSYYARVFIDGIEASEGEQLIGTGTQDFKDIGQRGDNSLYLNGIVDEVIYKHSYAPSNPATEAASLYNSGNGVASDSIITLPTFYYKMDESGTDTTAVDSSGNGYNGTLTNFPSSGMWNAH